ncbi:unnamed protein product [Pleuronectes platessa]|uniref:Uncharacterized protein n=1 Tax=Pleuronectes platessa TaxID=8262 RepID=A0A9N7YGS7_PLEPL|nr:unnamed protein product [Pleuronectes platessa]
MFLWPIIPDGRFPTEGSKRCDRGGGPGERTEKVMSASRKDPAEKNLTCPKPRPTWASPCPPPLNSHHE